MRKKVLHIAEAFSAGIFSYLVDTANLSADEYDVSIAFALRPQTPCDYAQYFDPRVRLIPTEHLQRSISLPADWRAWRELRALIRELDPDIVHLHSAKAGFIGRFAADCRRRRVFYHPHGYAFLMTDQPPIKRAAYRWLEAIAGLNDATVIGCSPGEYAEARKLSRRAICIENGLHLAALDKLIQTLPARTADPNCLAFGTCARIDTQKQPALFHAIARVFSNDRFVWIGDGALRHQLEAPNIQITGWLPREQALARLHDIDVFLLTSAWEGLPIALLEAMYMGKLCIVSDAPGCRDVIRHGVNGFICRDADAFCAAIAHIRSLSADERDAIRAAARRDVLAHHDMQKTVREKLFSAYET